MAVEACHGMTIWSSFLFWWFSLWLRYCSLLWSCTWRRRQRNSKKLHKLFLVRSLRGGKHIYDTCFFHRDRVFIESLFFILLKRMEDQSNTISAGLLSLTYGAFIAQIVKDYEDITEINKQIELLGFMYLYRLKYRYNMGLRLVEDYLSKTHTRGIKSFQATCQDIALKAFPIYTGMEASVENWNSDEQSCLLRIHLAGSNR